MSVGASFAADVSQNNDIQKTNNDTIVSSKDTVSLSSIDEKIANADDNIIGISDVVNDSSLVKSGDETTLSASDDGSFTALKVKLQNPANKTTIKLENDYKYVDGESAIGYIHYTYYDNLVIDGQGHTIDGGNTEFHLLFTRSSNIEVKNINFKNFSQSLTTTIPDLSGGYIYTSGMSSMRGIIMFNACTQSSLTNCNFTKVVSNGWGSALNLAGYAGNCFYTTVSNCNFINCSGTAGGVIYTSGHQESPADGSRVQYLTIDNCYFEGNYQGPSASRGSAMELNCRYATISNSIFIKNTAAGSGVIGLYSTAGYATIKGCQFINNTAAKATAISAETSNCPNTTVEDCYFEGNNATSGNGGAIRLCGQNGKISGCTFVNNQASASGGAISFEASNGAISNCNFTENSAKYGGAIYAAAKDSKVDSCKFENNNAEDGSNFYATDGNPITITNCGFDEFYVDNNGGGDGLRIGAPTDLGTAVQSIENGGRIILMGTFNTIANVNVGKPVILEAYDKNVVVDLSGKNSRALTVAGGNVTLKGITFKNSLISNADGGVIYWTGADGKVIECTFDNNTARNGGAIYWSGSNGNITGSTFTKNTATANGGAVYWVSDNGTMDSSTFTSNKAVYGSAVFLKTGVTNFEIKDTVFTSNTASTSGTVAAEKLTTFSLGGNTFTSNTVGSGDTDYYFYSNVPKITSSLVYVSQTGSPTSNGLTESSPTTLAHAIDDGIIENGGQIIFLASNYNFAQQNINNMNLTFVGRTGAVITGSRSTKVFAITNSNIKIQGLTFSSLTYGTNTVDAVISIASSNVNFTNCEFKSVTGSKLTSVVSYDSSSSGNMESVVFSNSNQATNIVNINGNVNIKDSTFTGNKPTTSSVYYNTNSKGTISGTTFSSNTGTTRNLYVNNNIVVSGNTFDVSSGYNSVSTIIYPNNVVLSASFNTGSNYAFSGIASKNGNNIVATGSVSNDVYSATWTQPLPGTYTVSLSNTDNKGNTFNYATTPSISVTVKLNTIYIGPSATGNGKGTGTGNLAVWDSVASLLTDTGSVIFTAGTYNLNGKSITKSWKLNNSGTVTIDAQSSGRVFTINANNVEISGITFKNGKVTDSKGSAIDWTGTGGKITNCVFNENTGTSITSASDLTITNTQMKNQITLTKTGDINWGSTETITATFTHSAPSTLTIKFNNVEQGTYTVSNKKVTQSYAYTNPSTRTVGD